MKDLDEVMSEASWTTVTKRKDEEEWNLEPGGVAEESGVIVPGTESNSSCAKPEGDSCRRDARGKMARKLKR